MTVYLCRLLKTNRSVRIRAAECEQNRPGGGIFQLSVSWGAYSSWFLHLPRFDVSPHRHSAHAREHHERGSGRYCSPRQQPHYFEPSTGTGRKKPGAPFYTRGRVCLSRAGASLSTPSRLSLTRGAGRKPGASPYTRKRLSLTAGRQAPGRKPGASVVYTRKQSQSHQGTLNPSRALSEHTAYDVASTSAAPYH